MAKKKTSPETAKNPLILRLHRLMDVFAKSDEERDFYLDNKEGFLIFVDLNESADELERLHVEIAADPSRFVSVPKLTFYEVKKIMEGFVTEKVYDIDTKEKLLDIIQAKDAREHFLEFIYDNETELEKWQQYYQERFRVRIIEWLRNNDFHFVFEEDLDLPRSVIEKVKLHLFDEKVPKDVSTARTLILNKAKTYYSSEALNPRPKRGRPPKQVAKIEIEQEVSGDVYTNVPASLRLFLYTPNITSASSIIFSEKYDTEDEFLAHLRGNSRTSAEGQLEALSEKFATLRSLSEKLGLDQEQMASPDAGGAFTTKRKRKG